ncbi:MAG: hypothetical protein H0W90_09090 [Actinobacteria bacterium]|nr:hypothetical protein [Actinomycetota bacterium]
MIAHWDEVDSARDLGQAAGALNVGLRRLELTPGETVEQGDPGAEEILFVLAGSGFSQNRRTASPLRAGDCIVRHVQHKGHSLRAGDDGLTVLRFIGPLARRPELGDEAPPLSIVNLENGKVEYEGEFGKWVLVARQAGAIRTGLNWGLLQAGRAGAPPHSHSADEELFVILEGSGTVELWPSPVAAGRMERETREIRAGHVISRPPSTAISHFLRAGEEGMTFLAYGTREPNDVCYYPRSNKIYWRGLGLIARLEPLDYDDGEPED